ncbi:MAG: hypothetical protein JWP42_2728, partial [Pseudomonas sp.]|nr:hypothetical protein [Pseudomonas sp.]
ELVNSFRQDAQGRRREVIKEEIDIYKKRVMYMMYATNIGMTAAILLLLSLVISGLNAMVKLDWLKYIGGPSILIGLLLVIPAAILVIWENMLIKRPIEAELADLGEFSGQAEPSPRQAERR